MIPLPIVPDHSMSFKSVNKSLATMKGPGKCLQWAKLPAKLPELDMCGGQPVFQTHEGFSSVKAVFQTREGALMSVSYTAS